MVDDKKSDKKSTDDLIKEPKAEEPESKPASDTSAPASAEPTPAGTDQQGR